MLITVSKSELIDTWCYHVTGLRKIRKSAAMSSNWRYVWHILRGWGGPEVSHPLEDEVNNLIQLFVCSAPSLAISSHVCHVSSFWLIEHLTWVKSLLHTASFADLLRWSPWFEHRKKLPLHLLPQIGATSSFPKFLLSCYLF